MLHRLGSSGAFHLPDALLRVCAGALSVTLVVSVYIALAERATLIVA
jgi:hypothetical protein